MNPYSSNPFSSGSQITSLGHNGFEVSLNYISGIPDPNIILDPHLKVIFKSLMKKDHTTKEKVLNELLQILSNGSSVHMLDDLVVITWVQLYAKLSIDSSKNVRSMSHQVQSRFVVLLGKNYAKYLKDTTPLWLTGLFDPERLVSKTTTTSLIDAFKVQEKVDSLWIVFHKQILNYCYQFLKFEQKDTLSDERFVGKEKAELKFIRVCSCCLRILNHLIQLKNLEMDDETTKDFKKIFKIDQLWDFSTSKDLNLKKIFIILINSIIINKPELVNEKIFKEISKSIINSLKYKEATNNIVYSSITIPTLSVLLSLTKFNNNFWELGGKKSKERFINFLKLGSCSSNELYYKLLSNLLDSVPANLIDFSNKKEFETISKILLKDVESERLIPFKNASWKCLLHVIAKFYSMSNDDTKVFINDFIKSFILVGLSTKLSKETINSYFEFLFSSNIDEVAEHINGVILRALPNQKIESEGKELNGVLIVNNFIQILSLPKSTLLDNLVNCSVKSLDEINDTEEYVPPRLSFEILNSVLTNNLISYKIIITDFIENKLVSFVESNFLEEPLTLLTNYNNSTGFVDIDILNECYNNFFSKVLMIDEALVPKVLSKLPKLNKVNADNCPDVKAYIHNKSANFEFNDHEPKEENLIFKFLNKETFSNLFRQADDTGNQDSFVKAFLSNFDNQILLEFLKSRDNDIASRLFKYLFQTISNGNSLQFLVKIEDNFMDLEEISNIYFTNLISFIKSNSFNPINDILNHISEKFGNNDKILRKMIPENTERWITLVDKAIGSFPDLRLSIANSLEHNIFLVSAEIENEFASTFDFENSLELITYGRFLMKLFKQNVFDEFLSIEEKCEVYCFLAVIGEIATDYNFLSDDENIEIMEIHSQSIELFLSIFSGFTITKLSSIIFDEVEGNPDSLADTILKFLNTQIKGKTNMNFYFNRVFKILLSQLIEAESLSNFQEVNINYNKLLETPLKFASFILSSKKFLTLDKFERIRNVLASGLIGLKNEQILTKGLLTLTLLNNFLLVENESEKNQDTTAFVPIPLKRLNMVLRDLNGWLESEFAFEKEFIAIRIQLLIFVNSYLNISDSSEVLVNSTMFDFAFNLFRESIGVVSVEQQNIELQMLVIPLEYFVLKNFIILNKNRESMNVWEDEIEGTYNELVDILLNSPNNQKDKSNQPIILIQDLLVRIFSSIIPLKKMEIFYDEFFNLVNGRNLIIQRLGTDVLYKLILEKQQAFTIEYELAKSKFSKSDNNEDDEDLKKAVLPEQLLSNVLNPPEEYIEYEDRPETARFLWSWYLIFAHFKDITHGIRADYTNQLKEKDLINKLLNFVFHQIDIVDDNDFLKQLTEDSIKNYHVIENDYIYRNVTTELKHLIVHLYYLTFQNLGSSTLAWFVNIRNRQLKSNIEKFSIKHISPIVINEELDRATEVISKNMNDDENLSIRINRITHEIKSVYLIDEKTMEMVIKIPSSYPLANVLVEGPLRIGVKENQWRAWLLASQRVITSHNGTIIDAIELFNKNVSLHFSGFEECAICYSILHYQDSSLPTKTCTTCNNKFHAGCLYKWFKSSGASSCPLCRSTFNFRK